MLVYLLYIVAVMLHIGTVIEGPFAAFFCPQKLETFGCNGVRGMIEVSIMRYARNTGMCTNKPQQKQHSVQKGSFQPDSADTP